VATSAVERAPFLRRWRSFRVLVEDTSMEPALSPGDRLYVESLRRAPAGTPRVGSVVVAPDPSHPDRWLIKRVAAVGPATVYVGRTGVQVRRPDDVAPVPSDAIDRAEVPAGELYLLSDGAAGGRDSRSFGPIPRTSIRGVAWWRYGPRERVGSIPGTAVR
jgi:signal peptidase I